MVPKRPPATLPPLVAIVGPTASGKSEVAIELAEEFHGEIISADSRQVYKGMDIGTGKVLPQQQARVPHHLLDIAKPTETYTLAEFQRAALTAIHHIHERGLLPFLVGGTGLYVQAIVDNLQIPAVPPQVKLRAALEKLTLPELQQRLQAVDPVGFERIDLKNPRRIIRAIEVSETAGVPFSELRRKGVDRFDTLLIGIKKDPVTLRKRIESRLQSRLERGMVDEVKRLNSEGVSWEQLEAFGLEYRRLAEYLQKKCSYDDAVAQLQRDILNFSKRQMTWFKRDKRIQWVEDENGAEELVSDWLVDRSAAKAQVEQV